MVYKTYIKYEVLISYNQKHLPILFIKITKISQ